MYAIRAREGTSHTVHLRIRTHSLLALVYFTVLLYINVLMSILNLNLNVLASICLIQGQVGCEPCIRFCTTDDGPMRLKCILLHIRFPW
jgi:hypothetical protein